jgi:hypothetical protein
MPSLIPVDPDECAGSYDGLAGLEDVDHERFYAEREAALGLCPPQLHLYRTVFRALDSWGRRVDERVELAGVVIPPLPLGSMVVAGRLPATMRAVPEIAFRALNMDVYLC